MRLVEFLTSRLDEDEIAALDSYRLEVRTAAEEGRLEVVCCSCGWRTEFGAKDEIPEGVARTHRRSHAPNRARREVEAHRAIVDEHAHGSPEKCWVCRGAGNRRIGLPCPTVRQLTAIYSDHPDYREEWRP